MKARNKIVTGFFLFLATGVFATNASFEAGVRAYQNGAYDEALEQFRQVLREGKYSANLYYNIGSSYMQMDSLGKSILFFERALKIDPGHQSARGALESARNKMKIQITEIPDFILWRWYVGTVTLFSADNWGRIQIASGITFLIGLYLFWFSGSRNLWVLAGMIIAICIFFGSWWASHEKSRLETGAIAAIVMSDMTHLYEAPDERSDVVSELCEGNKLYILDQIGGWVKVQMLDKDVGWIEIKKVEII